MSGHHKSNSDMSASVPLPLGWRKVPSRSRPGEFSYQDIATGIRYDCSKEPGGQPRDVAPSFLCVTDNDGNLVRNVGSSGYRAPEVDRALDVLTRQ